jgi:hypothetical protein
MSDFQILCDIPLELTAELIQVSSTKKSNGAIVWAIVLIAILALVTCHCFRTDTDNSSVNE